LKVKLKRLDKIIATPDELNLLRNLSRQNTSSQSCAQFDEPRQTKKKAIAEAAVERAVTARLIDALVKRSSKTTDFLTMRVAKPFDHGCTR